LTSTQLHQHLRDKVDEILSLIQQQRLSEARGACCEAIAEARILQQQLRIEDSNG
jgi:hypothetical protein